MVRRARPGGLTTNGFPSALCIAETVLYNEKRHCAKHSAFIVISAINASVNPQIMAEWTGLEPATPGVTGRYSNQLNYHSW